MMRSLFVGSVVACVLSAMSAGVSADTGAPNLQMFVLQCEGASVTVVSPVFQARAAQLVNATGVGVLQQVVFEGESGREVLFEQPSLHALRASALTSCSVELDGATLTLTVLMTPQHGR